MNLTELVDLVCLESGYNDAGDVAAAKKFFRHWDEHIWNAALWKGALAACDVAVDPETDLNHAAGVVVLPEGADRVVAVRTETNSVRVMSEEHYYRVDADNFVNDGTPVEFHHLPPAWFTWRPDPSKVNPLLILLANDVADAAVLCRLTYQDQTAAHKKLIQVAPIQLSGKTMVRVESLSKKASTGKFYWIERVDTLAANVVSGSYTQPSPGPITTNMWRSLAGVLVPGATYRYVAGNAVFLTNFPNAWVSFGGPPPTSGGIPEGDFVATDAGLTLGGPAGLASTALIQRLTRVDTDLGYELGATETHSPKFPQIRLVPMPTAPVSLKVLVKAAYTPMDTDECEPALGNAVACLCAYVRGSLKRRGQELAASQGEFQEANGLLKQLMQLEAFQAAHHQRFTPDDGFGGNCEFRPGARWGI